MRLYPTHREKPTLDNMSGRAIQLLAILRRVRWAGVRPGTPFGNAAAELVEAGYAARGIVCGCCGLLTVEAAK